MRIILIGNWRFVMRFISMALALLVLPTAVLAAEPLRLTLKNHRFTPDTLHIVVGERVPVEVENQDATPAEFESFDFKVEKIIVPNGKIKVLIGPLKAGKYNFLDDYHPDEAKGTLIVSEGGK